jgi:hypothetical protein
MVSPERDAVVESVVDFDIDTEQAHGEFLRPFSDCKRFADLESSQQCKFDQPSRIFMGGQVV